MSFAKRLYKAFFPGPKQVSESYAGLQVSSGDPNFAVWEFAYRINPWVYACVRRIADTVASLPLKLYRPAGESGEGGDIEVVDHEILSLLRRPGVFWSGLELMQNMAASYALDGESILYVNNGSDGASLTARPVQLQPMKSQFISVVPDKEKIVKAYRYTVEGKTAELPPEFFVHVKNYNPFDSYRGLSPIRVANEAVSMGYFMDRHNAAFFRNGARPGGILMAKDPLGDDVMKANMERFMKVHGGVDKHFGVAYLNQNHDYKDLAVSAKDGEFLGLAKYTREQVAAIFLMPPVLLGVFEFANYANSEQQIEIFVEWTIKPLLKMLADGLNNGLLWRWYDPGRKLYLAFDTTGISWLQEDQLREAMRDKITVQTGIETVNEVRARRRLKPVPWGNEPPAAPMPASFGLAQKTRRMSVTKNLEAARVETWKSRDLLHIQGLGEVQWEMRKFFSGQADRVVANLLELGAMERASQLNPTHSGGSMLTLRAVDPDALFSLFDIEGENGTLRAVTRPALEKIMRRAGVSAMEEVGSAVAFREHDVFAEAFLARKLLKVTEVNRTTKDMLRTVLVDAAANDLTVDETARNIRAMFGDMTTWRSSMIARTEVVGANNAGLIDGFQQSGVVQGKEWLSSRDADVRDSHAELDGQQVGIDEPFANGLQFPGDDGDPAETINCRCTTLAVLSEG